MNHVLLISSGYPTEYEPLDGIFYRDQAEALCHENLKVGMLSVIPISIFSFLKRKKFLFGKRQFIKNGVHNYLWIYLNRPKSPLYPVKKAKHLGLELFTAYIKEQGLPDVIHMHGIEAGELVLAIFKKYNIPYVVTEHSSKFLLGQVSSKLEPMIFNVYKQAKTCIAVSDFLASTLESKYRTKFVYIPNIVDITSFKINSEVPKKSSFTFVNVAGLNANKNQKMLIESFKIVHIKYPEVRLDIVGDGPLLSELEKFVLDENLANSVHFLGFQTRKELTAIYNRSHVFVLSSIRETFGVVLIEAMSCGLPVVATKCGGPESIIKESYIGELTEITVESLSLAMEKIYLDWSSYDANKISEFAENNFSNSAVVSQLMNVYKQ